MSVRMVAAAAIGLFSLQVLGQNVLLNPTGGQAVTQPQLSMPGTCSTSTGAISNVTNPNNVLIVTPQSSLSAAGYKGMSIDAYISAAGAVTLEVCNPSASPITPTVQVTFTVKAF